MKRKDAREFMMKVFFQMDAQNDYSTDNADRYLESINGKNQYDYCKSLHTALCENRESIDEKIAKYSVGWTIERMPKTDIATLRLAVCEMYYEDDVPPAVAINEAVELAKKYGTDQSPKFVNAILGSISREE